MTPKHLRLDLVNAYEGRDREAFERALDRMMGMLAYAGPIPEHEQVHAQPQHPVNNGTFAGSLHCTRSEGCACTSWPQAKTCMHRRSA